MCTWLHCSIKLLSTLNSSIGLCVCVRFPHFVQRENTWNSNEQQWFNVAVKNATLHLVIKTATMCDCVCTRSCVCLCVCDHIELCTALRKISIISSAMYLCAAHLGRAYGLRCVCSGIIEFRFVLIATTEHICANDIRNRTWIAHSCNIHAHTHEHTLWAHTLDNSGYFTLKSFV